MDASHIGNKLTYQLHTGILIIVNNTSIDWFSMKQNTVKTSSFGAELIAARIAMEKVKAMRTKLRWFGIPIDRPTYMFCDNESVVKSTSRAESTLSKKHQLISWHSIWKAISAGWLKILKEPGVLNLADLFTKQLPISSQNGILNAIYSNDGKSIRNE